MDERQHETVEREDSSTGSGEPEVEPKTVIAIEEPEEDAPTSRKLLFLQMIVFPVLIVVICVSIILLIGYLVGSNRSPEELLAEIRTGWGQKRAEAAFEFARLLGERSALQRDEHLAAAIGNALHSSDVADDVEARRYLVKVLAMFQVESVIPTLIEQLSDSDEATVIYAVSGLGRPEASSALEPLIRLLSNDSPQIRMAAAIALAGTGDPRAAEEIRPLLRDPDLFVRMNATFAEAKLNRPDLACINLVEMANEDWLDRVAWAPSGGAEQKRITMQQTISCLLQLECPDGKSRLEALARDARDLKVRAWARDALDRWGK